MYDKKAGGAPDGTETEGNGMNQAEQVLLNAIGRALFGADAKEASDTDWEAVRREAETQAVLGVAARGVPEEVRLAWKQSASRVTANYLRYLHAQDALVGLLDRAGIPFALLKGAAAAVYYPAPSARETGDIDFIVPQDRFEETKRLLSENGYRYNPVHENVRHVGFDKGGTSFELHRRFSYPDMDLEQYVIDGLTRLDTASIDGHRFTMLPKTANGLVLLAHMMRHLQSGLGLRQALDWMMFVDRELDDDLWNAEFRAAAASIGLERFAVTATRICERALGLPKTRTWTDGADDALADDLLNCLLSSGNFGRKEGEGGKIETVMTYFKRDGLFYYLQRAGESNWKAYHKHPWLKPFAWFYQIFRYLKQGIRARRTREQLQSDLKRSDARAKLLSELRSK